MKSKLIFLIGIFGVGLFIITSIVGGFLIKDYNMFSQLISETYAIDTEYGLFLRTFGHIPSGILITLFCLLGSTYFQVSKLVKIGFFGIAIFYGVATIIVGVFPCDSGCNKEFVNPSNSQIIHNLIGMLTYIFVPICMFLIGIGLRKSSNYNTFSLQSIICGITSVLVVFLLVSNPNSTYIGLYQRMVESVFIVWIIFCAITIKNYNNA